MPITTKQAIDGVSAVLNIANAVLETVKEAGPAGAPSGPMYAAFQQHGISLGAFTTIVSILVDAGKIKKIGDCYYPL